ncbi:MULTISPECIES: DNA-3-methyladenine glycosylase family protein [unclassified Streptomyces]|uniref:DNA-3-methyladenine glycosylase family protein n=1 Tax=Streptomyces TaxID=1883 RepID=UPI0019040F8F|nr:MULTISPECIES: DNA-3-methyladenine glycosylase 2 family protein [unclassified Streptomyces]MCU4748678.1 DNA-3-methyladenine glycosylase 2 family protein [Streptomyces sp. G-5]QQN79180.1 DNA-3-methyladenine glycosylase 2 family protein [Streptomyces sp. XC 2026]
MTERPLEEHWTPPGSQPYDLRRSIGVLRRGPYDPAFGTDPDGTLWRATRTPRGAATLRLRQDHAPDRTVRAAAWGPGAAWVLERLPALLGGEDDPSGFAPRHRVVAESWRRNQGLRLIRTGQVMEVLVPCVLEQRVTTEDAHRSWRLLLRRFGEPAPGAPRLYVPPDARTLVRVPSWEWHRAGVDGKRSAAIVRAARVARRMEEAAAMDLSAAVARLCAIDGIGPWTAAETLQRSNGAPDAVTVGDLHLPGLIGYALTGERGADDARMLELLEPYAGQRHRAARLILLSGVAPARRAPRQRHARIARL